MLELKRRGITPEFRQIRDGRIYRLAVPVLKKKKLIIWSFHVVVVQVRLLLFDAAVAVAVLIGNLR